MVVDEHCKLLQVQKLCDIFKSIDPQYDERFRQKTELHKMPLIKKFLEEHTVSTQYSFSIQKYVKESCTICKNIRSLVGPIQDLVMQRQPTPIENKMNPGYFFTRKQACKRTNN